MDKNFDLTRRGFLGTLAAAASTAAVGQAVQNGTSELQVKHLRCEYLANPLGIDEKNPRLSWIVQSSRRNCKQTGYRILVASSKEDLLAEKGDLWDSGRISSNDFTQIHYGGRELESRRRCYWKVRVWDEEGWPSPWSAAAFWEMGLLQPSDWKARWIGTSLHTGRKHTYTDPAPFFRKLFEVPHPVISARAYICGLGFYELWLNGARVGDHVLSPNQTNYDRRSLWRLLYPFDDKTSQRVLYVTHDVTWHLRTGKNVAGIILGHGWYNQRDRLAEGYMWYSVPRVILQLEILLGNGERQVLVTDGAWNVTTAGPITHDGIFTGEDYDARIELGQWLSPDFDDSGWVEAKIVRPPTGLMRAQKSLPDKVTKTFRPLSVAQTGPDTQRVDLGQNLAGWARIRVQGPRGRRIQLRFIEDNGPDYGQSDSYVLKGAGIETFEPRFTWHGFRQIEMSGVSRGVTVHGVEGRVVHAAVETAGRFECTNTLFNRILHNCRWSMQSNMHCGIPSDCPHRERVGYTGDWGQVAAEAAIFNFNMAPFYSKWLDDMNDAQNSETGFVPHSAPFEGGGGGPPWGCGYVVVAWLMYLYYGDRQVLERHYSGMSRWIEYLKRSTDQNGLVVREEPGSWCLGEWAPPQPLQIEIPPPLVNTCYYAWVAQLMSKVAGVLGRTRDVTYFAELAKAAGRAVNKRYFDKSKHQYYNGRQGANIFPLAFGLIPEDQIAAVFERTVEIIVQDNREHFDTGIFGTRLVLDVLTSHGRADVAYAMMNQTTFPSFGYQIEKGATTLWEDWNGRSSHNHAMFGSVCHWFYKSLAGINPDPAAPGFDNIVICPHPVKGLTSVRAEYQSIRGRVLSSWKASNGRISLAVEIPAGSTARVHLPVAAPGEVSEGGGALAKARGVRILRVAGERIVCAVGSGKYEFQLRSYLQA